MEFDIRFFAVAFLAITISLTVHEFAHAWVADRLGDPTPRQHGRLTLNPLVLFRAYPIGALIVPLLGALNGLLIGWAATPVNPSRVRRRWTVRQADLMISGAGPLSNAILGLLAYILYAVLVPYVAGQGLESPLAPVVTLL